MSNIKVEDREIVIPGQILAEGMDNLPGENTYREDDKIHSKKVGLVSIRDRVIRVTAMSGPYVPKVGDRIIAQVIDITMSGWRVDTGTAYSAMLNVTDATTRFIKRDEDLSQILAIGDYLTVVITKVTSQNLIDVTMKEPGLGKIQGGRIIKVNSHKVPRIIGKKGSMISLLKEKTGCSITVGQNGFVSIKGTPENELKVESAIHLIEAKSHESGLTEKIEAFLAGGAA